MGNKKQTWKQGLPIQYQPESRIVLADHIPLRMPRSLQIEAASACNFKCKFCIHGNDALLEENRYHAGIMTPQLFEKIAGDLAAFGEPVAYVTMHARGEPLLNPHLCDMIRILKGRGLAKAVSFNTNGVLLTPERSEQLVDAGLDYIRFSIEGVSSQAYANICGVKLVFADLVSKIRYFYEHRKKCHVYVKITDYQLSEADRKTFFDVFGPLCDEINIEHITDTWKDAGLAIGMIADKCRFESAQWLDGKICPRIFFATQIRFDGKVVACDSDWEETIVFGDLNKQSLQEIWNGAAYNRFRYAYLTHPENRPAMCEGCGSLYMPKKDFLDDRAKELQVYFRPEQKGQEDGAT